MARIVKFVNQSSSFPELFLDLTTTEPEPELFSFCIFGGAGARAGKARQARLVLEPEPGSLDNSGANSEKYHTRMYYYQEIPGTGSLYL